MQTRDTCSPLELPRVGIKFVGDIKLLDGDCFAFVGRLEDVSVPASSQESTNSHPREVNDRKKVI
jgi:hypothetical protein